MSANNPYYPSIQRVYSYTKENYILIDDKRTGLPRKITILDFFNTAATLGLIPDVTALPSTYTSPTFDLLGTIPFTVVVPLATEIVDVSLYDPAGVDLVKSVDVVITNNTVTFESNVDFLILTAKIVYKA